MEDTVTQLLQQHGSINVKALRKHVLKALKANDADQKKTVKREYKTVVLDMDKRKVLRLDSDGTVQLVKRKREDSDSARKEKKSKKEKKVKKEKKPLKKESSPSSTVSPEETEKPVKVENSNSNTNPGGVTRLFLGNLPFAVDEEALQKHLSGTVTHIKWITDIETGKFYGSAFVEIKTPQAAADAVAMNGKKLMGRPIKISYAPARPNDPWPPQQKVVTGGKPEISSASKKMTSMSSEKPEGCVKLFLGNLSYEITDETLTKFLLNGADAEPKAIRWIHHSDTGDFKGVGFCEFWSTEACERAAKLNGKNLLGRPIRMDWTD